jgi:hypothetical protein
LWNLTEEGLRLRLFLSAVVSDERQPHDLVSPEVRLEPATSTSLPQEQRAVVLKYLGCIFSFINFTSFP